MKYLAALLLLGAGLAAQVTAPMPVNGAITLNWPATVGQGYVLDRIAMDPAGADIRLTPATPPFLVATTWTDAAIIMPDTTYTYRVQAVLPSGAWMVVGTFTYTTLLPSMTEVPRFSNGEYFLKAAPQKGINCTRNGLLQQPGKDYILIGTAILTIQAWLPADAVSCGYVESP